ncbi:MAG: hypothetical protein JNL48_11880 [Acidobacteria bacterium]|nr:hypothetical protein [Acidobacteriota bacterium]
MTRRDALASMALGLVPGPALARHQRETRELPNAKVLGSAVSEYNDGRAQVIAAYYYSQRQHDGPWVLVELGFRTRSRDVLRRDHIEIETPSGDIVPLSGQRRWGADPTRAVRLLQQATPTRHQVRPYFGGAGINRLRFFSRPQDGYTVVDLEDSFWDPVLIGDLLFESPTGAWEPGRHVLTIGYSRGVAALPLDLK